MSNGTESPPVLAAFRDNVRPGWRRVSRTAPAGARPRLAQLLFPPPTQTPVDPPRRRLALPADPDVIYAIGDVHGCLPTLLCLEEQIQADAAQSTGIKLIVMLGDYVDRGPASAGVIEHLSRPPPAGLYRICLTGNHDAEFLRFLDGGVDVEAWLRFGGWKTLESYGCDLYEYRRGLNVPVLPLMSEIRARLPPSHAAFLRRMPISLETPSYFFVHAGIRPGISIKDQRDADLLWIRSEFIHCSEHFEKMVVHGHTPSTNPDVRRNRIGVDTGAAIGGRLTAARLSRGTQEFLAV